MVLGTNNTINSLPASVKNDPPYNGCSLIPLWQKTCNMKLYSNKSKPMATEIMQHVSIIYIILLIKEIFCNLYINVIMVNVNRDTR